MNGSEPFRNAPEAATTRVLGVDPGFANLGLGLVAEERGTARLVACRTVITRAGRSNAARLMKLREALVAFAREHEPTVVAIEGQFFHHQRSAAFQVGQAVGVVLLTAAELELQVHEYGPMQVKQALVGTGRADKAQVAFMVRALLGLSSTPNSSHEADALAVALTHLQGRRVALLAEGA